jgi:hypothetical protein
MIEPCTSRVPRSVKSAQSSVFGVPRIDALVGANCLPDIAARDVKMFRDFTRIVRTDIPDSNLKLKGSAHGFELFLEFGLLANVRPIDFHRARLFFLGGCSGIGSSVRPIIRQNSAGHNARPVTILQSCPLVIHFKTHPGFGEGQVVDDAGAAFPTR